MWKSDDWWSLFVYLANPYSPQVETPTVSWHISGSSASIWFRNLVTDEERRKESLPLAENVFGVSVTFSGRISSPTWKFRKEPVLSLCLQSFREGFSLSWLTMPDASKFWHAQSSSRRCAGWLEASAGPVEIFMFENGAGWSGSHWHLTARSHLHYQGQDHMETWLTALLTMQRSLCNVMDVM